MSPVLAMRDVRKTFDMRHRPNHVLTDLSLTVQPGEAVWINGPSGVGKTTVLSIAGLLMPPDQGTVSIDGTDTSQLKPRDLAKLRGTSIGFVFQSHNLFDRLSVSQNIRLACHSSAAENRVETLISRVGLDDFVHQDTALLSGGQRQRVAIARALVNQPSMILADEPISGLDDENSNNIARLLKSCTETGAGLIIASHNQLVGDYVDRIVELAHDSASIS